MPLHHRAVLFFLLIILVLSGTMLGPRSAHAATQTDTCQAFNVPVTLDDILSTPATIYGELCNPASGASHTVQLLVPGGTYGHIYWNFPYQPQNYSYVHALTAAGYSTFNIDRIGIGKSSHPPIGLLTVSMNTNAYVVHQIIQALRSGNIGNQPFDRVLLVGHSLGSVISWIEAGTYHDVDGVIITGLLHHLNATSLAGVVATLYPATLDPRFANQLLNLNYTGYLTTEPGTRGSDFYYVPGADPNVLATDEATKETATPGEFASFATPIVDGISLQINVPVLVVVGQKDALFCGLLATDCTSAATIQQAEAPYYSSQAQLQVAAIPEAGHDINLHKTAPSWFAIASAWASQHVAP
ncbi:alpha/beta hydrolase [Dictyobacter kobayashii]|uniref:Alpha/beta hydrolase n=1 Tax=Dictyobacter kobayashii TaxID=2014872 RepID=A0A402ANU1_9CHLR|nr:alpha/beta hydrolase [Dictyobacter kobayashii]GCE20640.1 alpha/beta hydrolase [Dictyobacter kobayashii]